MVYNEVELHLRIRGKEKRRVDKQLLVMRKKASCVLVGSLYFKIMEMSNGSNAADQIIIFEMVKKVRFGQAVFLSGSLEQLGRWDPLQALRLSWEEGNKWQGRLSLLTDALQNICSFEFKFFVSDWDLRESSLIEWQIGNLNRRINIQSILQGSNIYYAQWNMQNYIFFLKTQDFEQRETFYMQGSLQVLGRWQQKKLMKRLGSEKANPFFNYWKNNPQFAEQSSFSRVFMNSFSISREIESFNYFYVSFGTTIQSETFPGRICRLMGDEPVKDRIIEFDWQGSKVIIDECTFDKMILQRFTSQIYLASRVQTIKQFHRILDKQVTVLFILMTNNQDYKASTNSLRAYGQDSHLLTYTRSLDSLDHASFHDQLKEVVDAIQSVIISGHRVCLQVSSKVLRMFPFHMLYMILFKGFSFGEALEIISKTEQPPQLYCKQTRQIYNYISARMMRGCVEVKK